MYLGATRHISEAKQPKTCCCLSLTTNRDALLLAACLYRVFKLIPSLQTAEQHELSVYETVVLAWNQDLQVTTL